jgi:signal peptidase I
MIVDILKKIAHVILDMIQTVVMAGAVFVIMYLFVFQPNQVKGNSMLTNFENGEYVLTDKITYRFVRPPEPGDVVVFKAPKNDRFDFIKRVVAVPGQRVKVFGGRVHVNGQPLEEAYLDERIITNPGAYLMSGKEALVGENEYLVLGDNRDHSSDSRDWGMVPEDNIVGRVWLRYWPPGKLGLIGGDEGE